LLLKRIGSRGAKDRAALGQDAAYVGGLELLDQAFSEATGPAVLHAADLVSELKRPPGHGADGRVEPGRIAAPGQNSDSHGN